MTSENEKKVSQKVAKKSNPRIAEEKVYHTIRIRTEDYEFIRDYTLAYYKTKGVKLTHVETLALAIELFRDKQIK